MRNESREDGRVSREGSEAAEGAEAAEAAEADHRSAVGGHSPTHPPSDLTTQRPNDPTTQRPNDLTTATPDSEEKLTGLPGVPTWSRVYLWVLGIFAAYVVLLTLLSKAFT